MIKSNTIIDPTQSSIVVVVSGVGEKISDVNGDVMTQHQSGSERWKHKWCDREETVKQQKSTRTDLEPEPVWWKRRTRPHTYKRPTL